MTEEQVPLTQEHTPSLPSETSGTICCHDNRRKSMIVTERRKVEQTLELLREPPQPQQQPLGSDRTRLCPRHMSGGTSSSSTSSSQALRVLVLVGGAGPDPSSGPSSVLRRGTTAARSTMERLLGSTSNLSGA